MKTEQEIRAEIERIGDAWKRNPELRGNLNALEWVLGESDE